MDGLELQPCETASMVARSFDDCLWRCSQAVQAMQKGADDFDEAIRTA